MRFFIDYYASPYHLEQVLGPMSTLEQTGAAVQLLRAEGYLLIAQLSPQNLTFRFKSQSDVIFGVNYLFWDREKQCLSCLNLSAEFLSTEFEGRNLRFRMGFDSAFPEAQNLS